MQIPFFLYLLFLAFQLFNAMYKFNFFYVALQKYVKIKLYNSFPTSPKQNLVEVLIVMALHLYNWQFYETESSQSRTLYVLPPSRSYLTVFNSVMALFKQVLYLSWKIYSKYFIITTLNIMFIISRYLMWRKDVDI